MNHNKVMIIDLGRFYGGAEKMLENLIDNLSAQYKIFIAVNEKGNFGKALNDKVDVVKILCGTTILSYVKSIRKISKIIKREEINIIHVNGIASCILGLIMKKIYKVKLVVTIHSDLEFDFKGIKKRIYFYIEKSILKNSDHVVAVSQNLKCKLEKRVKSCDIRVIYNGIHSNNKENFKKCRSKKLKFLYVGRLEEVKNLPMLLEALYELSIKKYDFECEIVGDGEKFEDIKKYIKEKSMTNIIKLEGFKSNIDDYMKNCDILIMTSKMEGIPMVIIEAFKNRIPVLASRVGGIPEMIEDEFNGILFNVDNFIEFIEKLENIINGVVDLNLIAENAHNTYLEKWTSSIMSKKYEEIFRN